MVVDGEAVNAVSWSSEANLRQFKLRFTRATFVSMATAAGPCPADSGPVPVARSGSAALRRVSSYREIHRNLLKTYPHYASRSVRLSERSLWPWNCCMNSWNRSKRWKRGWNAMDSPSAAWMYYAWTLTLVRFRCGTSSRPKSSTFPRVLKSTSSPVSSRSRVPAEP